MRLGLRRADDLERRAARSLVRQHDESDCGPACLAWIVRFFGGMEYLEELRRLTGTTAEGTTLLGLNQGARQIGLDSDAYRAGVSDLRSLAAPAILHVVFQGHRQHFIVHFGQVGTLHLIGDPEVGLIRMTDDELSDIWTSSALILVRPGPDFVDRRLKSVAKRNWLLGSIRADARALVLSTVLGAAISVLGLATALFSKILIDDILPNGDASKLVVGIVLLLLVLATQTGMSTVRWILLLRQGRAFNVRVTDRFLFDLLRLPYAFFRSRKTGDLIARLNDTERLQRAVTHVLGGIVVDVLVICVGLAFIVVYSASIAVLVGGVLMIFMLITWHFHRPIVEGQHRVMSAHSANKSGYVEAISGIETIKTSNAEGLFSSLMQTTYIRLQDEVVSLGRVGLAFSFAIELVGNVVLVAALAWSSVLVLDNAIGIGALVAILQMIGMVVPAGRSLATANIELQEATVAFDRMYQLAALKPEYSVESEVRRSVVLRVRRLEIDGLTYRYPGRPALLDDVSFRCQAGEMIVLTGRTGSGKSSMLQLLQLLLVPESGRVLVNGCDWNDLSVLSWRDVLSVMPQHVQIFSGTLLDNIRLGLAADAREIIRTCQSVGFDAYFNALPQGYATLVGEGGIGLSGGQRQLVGLARAIVRDGHVMLLDEPTASMDDDTAGFAVDVIDRRRADRIVIVASHDRTISTHADAVYQLDRGRLVQVGGTGVRRPGNDVRMHAIPMETREDTC